MTIKNISHHNTCVEDLDPTKTYTMAIFDKPDSKTNQGKVLLKEYDIEFCNFNELRNTKIINTSDGIFELSFDKESGVKEYQISRRNLPYGAPIIEVTSSNKFNFSAQPGYEMEVQIMPICKNKSDYFATAAPTKRTFNTGTTILSNEIAQSSLLTKSIICNNDNFGEILMTRSASVQENNVNYSEAGSTEQSNVSFLKFVPNSKPDKAVGINITSIKDSNGKLKVYFRDAYCGHNPITFLPDGVNQIIKYFDVSENVFARITFNEDNYTVYTSKDLIDHHRNALQ